MRINAIAPSSIVTERLAAQPAGVLEEIAMGFPLGRFGRVDDGKLSHALADPDVCD